MYEDVSKILIDKDTIAKRVYELGAEISKDYEGLNPILVCTLRGAVVFFADLIRAITIPLNIDFIATSSYGNGTRTSGAVRLVKDLKENIEGRHLIIVEDIIDSGLTMNYLKTLLATRMPKSMKVCTLLDKPDRRQVELHSDYTGFVIPNDFVIGYGLDYNEKYRNLPEVCILKRSVYEK